jgi:hypothetical protein
MTHRVAPAVLLAIVAISAACSAGGERKEEPAPVESVSSPPLAPDGALIGVVMARAVGEDGQPVKPGLAFAAVDDQIAAIVGVGEVPAGSTVTIQWRRWVGPDEREPLFEHRIKVEPFQHAYSIGVSRGRLLAGIYEVVATLGENQSWSPLLVRDASEAELAATRSHTGTAVPVAVQIQPEHEPGPPAAGDSGAVSPALEDDDGEPFPDTETSTGCTLGTSGFWNGLFVEAEGRARGGRDQCGEQFVLAASVDRGAKQDLTQFALEGSRGQGHAMFHPCELPGGTDEPGTRIALETREVGREGEAARGVVTIPDLGPPFVAITSRPGPGARVRRGQRIQVFGFALGYPGPGLRFAELSGPGGVFAREDFGEGESCDPETFMKLVRGTYRVPDDPPPIITLQATVEDRSDRTGTANAEYYTAGEIWRGTVRSVAVDEHIPECPSREVVQTEINLAVSSSGNVIGNAVAASRTGHSNLGGACAGRAPYPATNARLHVTGRKTEQQFELSFEHQRGTVGIGILGSHFFGGVVQRVPLISPTRARGTDVAKPPYGGWQSTNTFSLRCRICEGD